MGFWSGCSVMAFSEMWSASWQTAHRNPRQCSGHITSSCRSRNNLFLVMYTSRRYSPKEEWSFWEFFPFCTVIHGRKQNVSAPNYSVSLSMTGYADGIGITELPFQRRCWPGGGSLSSGVYEALRGVYEVDVKHLRSWRSPSIPPSALTAAATTAFAITTTPTNSDAIALSA